MSPINVMGKAEVMIYKRELAGLMASATKGMVKEVAKKVAERAKANVAVDSGALKESIKGGARKSRGENRFIATIRTGKGKRGYRYGLDQEVGRAGAVGMAYRLRRSGAYKFKPFMLPAFRATLPEVPALLKQGAAKQARKQARKRGRPRKTRI